MDNYKYCLGTSMRPFVREGDLIYYRELSLAEIKTGDIILYKDKKNKLILHRVIRAVVKKKNYFLITKGDAADAIDPLKITGKELIGKAFMVERKQKRIRLEIFPYSLVNKALAFLSRLRLNPALTRKLYLDTILKKVFGKINFSFLPKTKIDYIFYPPRQIRAVLGNTILGAIEIENIRENKEEYRITRFWVKYLGQALGVKKGLIEHAERFVREKRATLGAGGCI